MLIINTTWKNLENTTLSERSQSYKRLQIYDSIYKKFLRGKPKEAEYRLVVA